MRARWSRLIAAGAVVTATALASGCVVFQSGPAASQLQTIGDVQLTFTACATNTAAGSTCTNKGNSDAAAFPGLSQALIGLRVPVNVTLPPTFTSTGPEALVFADSPGYAAELQRLDPAPAGKKWVGYITPSAFNYSDTAGPSTFSVQIPAKLGQAPDGSPFTPPLAQDVRLGGREVNTSNPATRPVACGPSLTTLFDDDPNPEVSLEHLVAVICVDAGATTNTATRDLGVLGGNATGSGAPGSLVSVPFTLRYAGTATAGANFNLSATSTLPNANLAVTPGGLAPATNSDTQALVAVGIPAGARAGTYDVTLTAKLANGQTRTRIGKLTVTGGGGGGGTTGGATVKLKLTTILPRGLSVVTARKSGIAVLIGANKGGTARVQLFQGTGKKNKKPKASKGVRLRVPGPTRVVLRSQKLKKGAYKVVITAGGRTFVKRSSLTK
jgi:hypothetical protein